MASKSHLHIQLKVPMSSDSILDQAEKLSALKPHIDALRDAAGDDHDYSEKIAKARDPSAPKRGRKPRVAEAA